MRPILVAVALVALLFAGCADDAAPDPADDDATGTTTGTTTGTETGTGTPDPEPEPEPEPRDPPAQTEFAFGPGAGCEGSTLGPESCASFVAGPDTGGPDGVWIPLDETYWGLRVRTTIDSQSGDSDCYFVRADGSTIISDAFNGSGPCGGRVPNNAGYMFLYSYVEPHLGMTATFVV